MTPTGTINGTRVSEEARSTRNLAQPLWLALVRLARPKQWAKGVFVLIGPLYALTDPTHPAIGWWSVVLAVLAFGFASSSCYVINDLRDREADRAHPRKQHRPVASGRVGTGLAVVYSSALLVAALASGVGVSWTGAGSGPAWGLLAVVAVYVLNTNLYSIRIKHMVILDVISLASGFVLRVIGGCMAAGVQPSTWLLNCSFFVSMFLAFGKRLGERRTLGEEVAATRGVQRAYTDQLLRMAVVVTAVASLVTYAGYVQAKPEDGELFNYLWVTMLPATYGLLRCIVLLERGRYDDPTELAAHDRGFQAAVVVFALVTAAVMAARAS